MTMTLEEREKAADAELAELETMSEARAEQREREAALVRKQRQITDTKAVWDFEEKVGPVDDERYGRVDSDVGVVIVECPKPVHIKRYMDEGSQKTEDVWKLVRSVLRYPDRAAFDAMVDQKPGLLHLVANKAAGLAGFRMKEIRGK
jgi:hypothetical protein